MRVAAIQMNSGADLAQNLQLVAQLLSDAARDGCALAVLPENFALMPERGRDKSRHAEQPGGGPIQDFVAECAARHGMWIIGGSMPLESPEPERVYGACLVVDDRGKTKAI
ncbi:MAG: carbon-nitrogen hydrolase family protein, partial [Gammaproteobacteria bacterium]|nr:carbon-nitrogen hydrolase family protein [Gammaproteobacteria bacterium]